jgi:hypothetical protein
MARDFYEVLGVPRTADAAEIQQAFRTLARRHHPDVNKDPAAEERFKEINEAYGVLSDPDTRARYDRFGADFRQVPEDYDERVAAAQGFGGGGPFQGGRIPGRGGPQVWTDADFGSSGVDFEDIFGGIFGGRSGRGGGPVPGADQEAELTLTLEEAYRGGRRKITLGGPGRAAGDAVRAPPGTSTWWSGSPRTPVTVSPAATSTSGSRSPPGRPRSGRPYRSAAPAARPRCRSPRARPAAVGCGCAARECPVPRAPPATSTRRSR